MTVPHGRRRTGLYIEDECSLIAWKRCGIASPQPPRVPAATPAKSRLMAVTKKFPSSVIRDAYASGLRDFGENYVQEFERKHPDVADLEGARFHLIGHLQSNKSRKAAEIFSAIDSLDSVKLVRRLQEQAGVLST